MRASSYVDSRLPWSFSGQCEAPTGSSVLRTSYRARAVELDALPPEILREKVIGAIKDHCDLDLLWGNKIEDNIKRELWRKRILKFKEVHG